MRLPRGPRFRSDGPTDAPGLVAPAACPATFPRACRLIEHTFRYAWFRVWPGRGQTFADGRGAKGDQMATQGHELRAEVRETAEQ